MKKLAFQMLAAVALIGVQPGFAAPAEPQYPPEPDINAHLPPWIMPPGPKPDSQYRLGPDSLPQPGVPKGEMRGPFVLQSQVFPGTQHTYWIYVPAQYDPSKPADLMVFQDGWAFKAEDGSVRAQNVMDNLIYRREIPVMIAVFINPGRRPDQPEPSAATGGGDGTSNRFVEYNTPDDKYARVLTQELLPAIYKDYNVSKNPDDHGIGGSSSGGIAAFEAAWQRPDAFHKVLTNVGSFVSMRGGDIIPDQVLSSGREPLRVFLVDGRNDHRQRVGTPYDQKRDWFYQNVRLMKALTRKGYDVNYSWSVNTHGEKYLGVVLPDMMRWLWRDAPVSTAADDVADRGLFEPAARR